ncbi:MAG: hypothetical protein AAB325_02675, partial [Pseudomonadota bacterium]
MLLMRSASMMVWGPKKHELYRLTLAGPARPPVRLGSAPANEKAGLRRLFRHRWFGSDHQGAGSLAASSPPMRHHFLWHLEQLAASLDLKPL